MEFNCDDPMWAGVLAKRYRQKNADYQQELMTAFKTGENIALNYRYPLASFTAAIDELSTDAKVKQHLMENIPDENEEQQKQRNSENEDARARMSNFIKLQQSRDILKACAKSLESQTTVVEESAAQDRTHLAHLYA